MTMTPSPAPLVRRRPSTMGSEQRKTLQFPLIPPLPPSNAYEKENQRQPDASSRSRNTDVVVNNKTTLATRNNTSTLTLTPKSRNSSSSHLSLSSSLMEQSPASLPRRNSNGSKLRVLRYGETIDSLFLLDNETTAEHHQLCRDIADGRSADDASSWLRAVQAASDQVAKEASSNADRGADLIRLHRRATSRFSTLSEDDMRKDEENILALWLAYATVLASHGSPDDARLTFRHMRNQHIGATRASFYLKFADFERQYDVPRAIQILVTGIDKHAAPLQDLNNALIELESMAKSEDAVSKWKVTEMGGDRKLPTQIPALLSASSRSPSRQQAKKQKPESNASPKRLKRSDETTEVTKPSTQAGDASRPGEESTLETAHARRNTMAGPRSNETASFAAVKAPESIRSTGREIATRTPIRTPFANCAPRPAFGSVPVMNSSHNKSSLMGKTPRLSRVGLSGKPMRVNAEENPASDTDSSMDIATQSDTLDSKLSENMTDTIDATTTKPTPKITKMDLSYMLEWDPNSRKPHSATRSEDDKKENSKDIRHEEETKTKTPKMDRIEEVPSNGSAASLVTTTLCAHGHESHYSDRGDTAHQPAEQLATETINPQAVATVEPTAKLDRIAVLIAKSNPDFLPLVSEDNILRVNKVPYAKLGVIGKGGSCKVYRALAKDCSILAIKKVKLGGMDQKAINGYANEIALLKRLRGNPSIIQIYDSEVDLSRKAIFVAMELGEVDLNQVIQQQTLQKGKTGHRTALDMNFIRLTWQQMLKAVHSIHEERIIHGDLKPANFLFVRGALKLIDFGIAKAIQSEDTTNIYRDSQIGTLNYMSPEAILDTGSSTNGARMKIGRASDIWSLGCILYQMVYGKTPFADLHMIQKLQAIVNRNHKVVFPSGVEDEGAVDAIRLCLRRDPEQRPPIIGEKGLLNEHFFLHARVREENKKLAQAS